MQGSLQSCRFQGPWPNLASETAAKPRAVSVYSILLFHEERVLDNAWLVSEKKMNFNVLTLKKP
jgi:hypothetical protein